MRKTLTSLLAGAALVTIAGSARAQTPYGYYPPYGGNDYGSAGSADAVLYEYPGFQGRSVVIHIQSGNLANEGFNDRARSARLPGTWRLCEDASFRGHCDTMGGDIPDLSARGINGLSALQHIGDGYDDNPGYPGGGYDRNGVQGRSSVFFPGPAARYRNYGNYGSPYGGYPYGGYGSRNADSFCRQMGYAGALYADTSHGEMADVLCRR